MKKVLIALDYSPSAQKIAELGFAFAKGINAQIFLLHVVSDFAYYSSPDYLPLMGFAGFSNLNMIQPDTVNELNKVAQDFLEKTKQHLGDDAIQTSVKDGDFADSIIETSKELNVDVIVMGTHSRHGLEKLLLGSVAEKVLQNSTIPLFIIPTKEP